MCILGFKSCDNFYLPNCDVTRSGDGLRHPLQQKSILYDASDDGSELLLDHLEVVSGEAGGRTDGRLNN